MSLLAATAGEKVPLPSRFRLDQRESHCIIGALAGLFGSLKYVRGQDLCVRPGLEDGCPRQVMSTFIYFT